MMSLEQRFLGLLNQFLLERVDLFLINYRISPSNDIELILDGDKGLSLQDCLDASRFIEFQMDRELEDFSLKVTSAGAFSPLVNVRQYAKNTGRTLDFELKNKEKISAQLVQVDADGVEIFLEFRREKAIGKGKETVQEHRKIEFSQIEKAAVAVKF